MTKGEKRGEEKKKKKKKLESKLQSIQIAKEQAISNRMREDDIKHIEHGPIEKKKKKRQTIHECKEL